MKRLLGSTLAVLGAVGVGTPLAVAQPAASASHGRNHVKVRPANGSPETSFVVSFRAPDAAGTSGGRQRFYVVSASGPNGDGSCVSQAEHDVTSVRAHARVHVMLSPGSNQWCAGTFHGTVTEEERPVCGPGKACPQWVIAKTIGHFRFDVLPSP